MRDRRGRRASSPALLAAMAVLVALMVLVAVVAVLVSRSLPVWAQYLAVPVLAIALVYELSLLAVESVEGRQP